GKVDSRKQQVSSFFDGKNGEAKSSSERPMKATADLQEGYVDDENNEVPESLFPVWRERERFMRLTAKVKEVETEVRELAKTPAGSKLAGVPKMVSDSGKAIAFAMPSIVNGKKWKSVGEAGK